MIVYGMNVSADGYVVDAEGSIDFTEPSEDVFSYWIGVQRAAVLDVYGRALYETMRYWQDASSQYDDDVTAAYGAIWRSAEKVVFSRTMTEVSTPRTSLRSEFDPAWVGALKASASKAPHPRASRATVRAGCC